MSQRRLPHFYPEDRWLFVTWHLHGSVPPRYPPPGTQSDGQAFVWMDRYMGTTSTGPMFLKIPEVARLVANALHRGVELGYYDLRAFVVMANHVHVLLRPIGAAARVLQWLKGTTAREANLLLGRVGEPFWQRECYDHWARDDDELQRIVAFIVNNPVKAGLVTQASEYRWSSAGELKLAAAR